MSQIEAVTLLSIILTVPALTVALIIIDEIRDGMKSRARKAYWRSMNH